MNENRVHYIPSYNKLSQAFCDKFLSQLGFFLSYL